MRTHGKKYRAATATLEPRKLHAPREAVEQVKAAAFAKFDESVDIAVRLGVEQALGRQLEHTVALVAEDLDQPHHLVPRGLP